ncbi:MAG: asparagine synthetase B, partial [Actinomycetales bacterium]
WDGENAPFLRDGALGLGGDVDDAYAEYVAWEHRKVQQYNVWHEDRTAAGSGIEARVPFLDHRLVDFTSRLPLDLRPELLWDKTILRRATSPFLPQDMVDRPKGPFFYGAGVHHTYRTFLSMLEQDGGALIERALDGPQAAQMLDGDALHAAVAELAAQPTSSPQVEIVLRLVNMGLLSGMAEEPPPPMIDAAPVQVMARASDAVDSSTRELELNGPLALTDDRSIGLSPRVLLLSRPEDGTWFLAVDGSIEYELEGDSETLVLLRALEGSTSSIKQICATAGLEPETIRDDVRQLISDGAVLLV